MAHERHGAKQPNRFDPARAAILDDPARFSYVPVDELLALLEIPAGGTLVDFGTGTGLYAIEIARRRPDVRVLALDEQPPMLAHVREAIARAGLTNAEAVSSDALSALLGSAARILALNVLHELGDTALGEVRTLLADHGTVLFVDWNAEVERPVGPPRDHVYGVAEAAERLAAAGFVVVERRMLAYHYALVAQARVSPP
ncbi:MAG TPA: class I SAM-dependent methyltransferase [Candidatus Elarobacter sp.]|jgi:SAM-dependent methyltransferase